MSCAACTPARATYCPHVPPCAVACVPLSRAAPPCCAIPFPQASPQTEFLMFMDDDNIAKPHEVSTFVKARARTHDRAYAHVPLHSTARSTSGASGDGSGIEGVNRGGGDGVGWRVQISADGGGKQSTIQTTCTPATRAQVAQHTGADVVTVCNDYFFGDDPPERGRVPTGRWVPLGAATTARTAPSPQLAHYAGRVVAGECLSVMRSSPALPSMPPNTLAISSAIASHMLQRRSRLHYFRVQVGMFTNVYGDTNSLVRLKVFRAMVRDPTRLHPVFIFLLATERPAALAENGIWHL